MAHVAASDLPASDDPVAAFPRAAGSSATYLALAIIIFSAALLRFVSTGLSPPGLNQDEACNAWNAWCLLHTGADAFGARWPIFYFHGLGDNRPALDLYVLM